MPDPQSSPTSASWSDIIRAEATKQGIDPRLALAVSGVESSGNPTAVSPKGAIGLMQLMPETAQRLGVDPYDPIQNIQGGLRELKSLLDQHGGDVVLALRRYNGSPTAPQAATDPYVQAVLGRLSPQAQPAGRLVSPAVGTSPSVVVNLSDPASRSIGLPPDRRPIAQRLGRPPSTEDFTQLDWGQRAGQALGPLVEPLDIRTPTGRRNVAGGVGAAGAVALTGGAALPALAAGVLGAAGGGMAAEAGEQIAGTAAPSSRAVLGAGAEQGAYEAIGQGLVWPVKAIGRRLLASPVSRRAATALNEARTATTTRLADALDAASAAAGDVRRLAGETVRYARRRAGEALRGERQGAADLVQEAEALGQQGVQAARTASAARLREARAGARTTVGQATETGETGVAQAEAQAAAGVSTATAPYRELVGQPPSAAMAGRAADAVVRGPAQEARDLLGRQVDQAAREGPAISIQDLKAEAQRLVTQIQPPAQTFPRRLAEGEEAAAAGAGFSLGTGSRELLEQAAAAGDPTAAATLKALGGATDDLAAAQAEAAREALKHPVMGVVNRILNADDVVPFYDAHLFKQELDDALLGSADKVVRKRVTSMTAHLRSQLRQALAGHAPYDQATAAYAKIVPLYTKEIAASFRKAAQTDPESIVRLISPKKPTAVRMLRDLLVGQSALVGKAGEGQSAWDLVRSAWTHSNVLAGGIEKLDANLGKLPKEFTDLFYGDATGQQVWRNLHTIAAAYKSAVETGAATIGTAKEAAGRGVAAAREAGRAGVEAAITRNRGEIASAQGISRDLVEQAAGAGRGRVEQARRVTQSAIEQTLQQSAGVKAQATQDVRLARRAKQDFTRTRTPQEIAFAQSSLGGRQPTPEELAAHGIRAFGLGPFQLWGGLSWLKLLSGPQEKDLIEWAAYSTTNTQRLVTLMTGPTPTGMAIADVLRAAGVLERVSDHAATRRKPTSQVGQPPPR